MVTQPKPLQWYHSKADLIWPDDSISKIKSGLSVNASMRVELWTKSTKDRVN
jgi:hypothetical protein